MPPSESSHLIGTRTQPTIHFSAVSPSPAHLFDVRVEGDRHVQQDFALLHAADKVLDSVFELVGGLVDLLRVALSRLGQLLGRLQELIRIGVSVLWRDRDKDREVGFNKGAA